MSRLSGPRRSRRAVLASATGLAVFAAGCLSDEEPTLADEESESNDGGGEDDEDVDAEESDDATTLETYETAFATHPELPAEPDARLHTDREDAVDWLADRRLDTDEAADELIDETPFEESVLVSIEASARNLCYELVLDEIDVDDGTLDIDASVIDESTPEQACAQQVTAVSLLASVTPADGVIDELSATVVDQDGTEHSVGADTERSESGSSDDTDAAYGTN